MFKENKKTRLDKSMWNSKGQVYSKGLQYYSALVSEHIEPSLKSQKVNRLDKKAGHAVGRAEVP